MSRMLGRGCFLSLVAAGIAMLSAVDPAAAQAGAVDSRAKGKGTCCRRRSRRRKWGWFNNAQPPVLRINSGDTVVIETMMHSHNQVVSASSEWSGPS
jgi:hypothetical protein